ncbi:MAG TPA: hypothetical protein DCW29_04340 [Janthinobacterium sp.]|nr:hypothetical protein [Janthinobacterium sp.]
MRTPHSLSTLVAGSLLLGACHGVLAAENNEVAVPFGLWGMDSAILPLSGWYGQVLVPSYRADHAKDTNGNDVTFSKTVPGLPGAITGTVDAHIKVDAIIPKLVYVSGDPVLRGRIGGYVALPLLDKSRDISVTIDPAMPLPLATRQAIGQAASQAASGNKRGMGDVEVAAFIGWKFENLSVVTALNVDLPTGKFDRNSQVNLGMNSYSFRPLVSAAWSTESGFDLAASLCYNYSTANRDTDYKSGQYVHLEYIGTYQFPSNLKVGVQGYLLHQTTDDRDPAGSSVLPLINGNRAHVVALGPVLSYQTENLKNQVEFKYLREFSARGRPQGGLLLLSYGRLF